MRADPIFRSPNEGDSPAAAKSGDLSGSCRRERSVARGGGPQSPAREPRGGQGASRQAAHAPPSHAARGGTPELDRPLEQVFRVDGFACPGCGGPLMLRCVVVRPPATRRILDGLRRATDPPRLDLAGDDRTA